MHAFLLVGNNTEAINKEIKKRIDDWKISPWDITRAIGTGIGDIRQFRRELSLTPRGSSKAGIIEHIELLTPEAQNALLKTLEEPPPNTYIVGTTGMPEAILPTVRSRMTTVKISETHEPYDTNVLLQLLSESPGKQLATLEPFVSSLDDAKKFVTSLLGAAQQEMLNNPSPKLTKLIRNLLAAESQLSVNVNQKMVVDNIFL